MEKVIVYYSGPASASNTKYYVGQTNDPRMLDGNWGTIFLDVPEHKFGDVLSVVNTFTGPAAEFNKRIQKVLNS